MGRHLLVLNDSVAATSNKNFVYFWDVNEKELLKQVINFLPSEYCTIMYIHLGCTGNGFVILENRNRNNFKVGKLFTALAKNI